MINHRQATAQEIAFSGLNHRVYLPEEVQYPRGAVVLVHGRAGNDRVMWPFSRAFREHKLIAVSPEAFCDDPVGGKSWWLVEEWKGDEAWDEGPRKPTRPEQLNLALDKLEFFISSLPDLYPIDPERVFAFGFSQGAAMVSTLSLRKPSMFKGVALLAGFIPRVVFDQREVFVSADIRSGQTSLPKYFMASGTQDATIPIVKAQRGRDGLRSLGAEVTYCTEDVGHKVGASCMRGLKDWFDKCCEE
ncbi:MAG: hypothetical protein KDD66_16120 [Bdellovibrionales bacterium]|nr:hypothetical protein [Bdellovibrionales bacterium]